MNILLISFDYPPLTGGIANVSYKIANELSNKEDALMVIAPALKRSKQFDNNANLNVLRIPNHIIIRDMYLFFAILYLILKRKIDIIYNLVWNPSGAVSYFLHILTGIPYVINVYAMDYFEDKRGFLNKIKYNWFRDYIKRLIFNNAQRIITLSNFMKDRLIVRGVDALRINVVAPGVDSNFFIPHKDPKEIISKYSLENKKVLLTVARLDDYKGHDMVIKTLPKLISKFPDIMYMVVGTGPYELQLRKLVTALNLDKYVIFAGWIEENLLPLYYNACDIYIMVSREDYGEAKMEGYGLVFLEASACGKPIIAGRSGGVEDAVVDNVTGVLVDPLDLNQIESAIERLLNDNSYAQCLGKNGLERIVRENLNWSSTANRIKKVLSQAIK